MAFSTGLSGLNAASKDLDVIGNNVANAATVGFKQGQAQFADIYANSLFGAGNNTVGIGTRVSTVAQQFTQGDITVTNRQLDLAISGNGFFRVSNNGTIAYSRNGQFSLDKNGYIVDANGDHLTGYLAGPNGIVNSVSPVDLQIPTGDLAPTATTKIAGQFNLDSRSPLNATAFSITDPTSYTNATSLKVYDSLGNSHDVNVYFKKTSVDPVTNNATWTVYGSVDGTTQIGAGPIGTMTFNTAGSLVSQTDSTGAAVTGPITLPAITYGNGASPATLTLNLTGTTQYGNTYTPNTLTQDGYTSGRLTGFTFNADGTIVGTYSNTKSVTLGQVALANFNNVQGLIPLGNNLWAESADSGIPIVGVPGGTNLGKLQAGAVEASNVDLTAELVHMITAQRNYQANAQTIKTEDQLMQTMVNL
ncbi:flagellar hook protein FlgE [Pandoraea communis]|uniref:Flagellar hook protein FlgE n=1 Tax=Pandoraea communis TaxID=2508297 RepID=A0A5E4T9S3_9BURK|nr:flagellar hook protein FlgE [Pandoraea communis]MDM8354913.1 flagellar hook protein FlgE [Pandoraea communis]VVD85006.1 flagellar hook protein FlgE [Pandoraea communis]